MVLSNQSARVMRALWFDSTIAQKVFNPTPISVMKQTTTSAFGVSKREGHDASAFYKRNLYNGTSGNSDSPPTDALGTRSPETELVEVPRSEWADRVYCQSSEAMSLIPDNSVALAFTSPPYNVGKEYDADQSLESYLALIKRVADEVYRVLLPGGRYVVNIANLGRKPYIPLHMYFYQQHMAAGFLPMGEIIWRKAKGASGNCAWGSWQSAKAPRLRDIHEYLLVFAKEHFSRPDRGASDISRDEFMKATLSIWEVAPESAKRVGHPAPFPVALAEKVIHLYSYVDDVVLDPFLGSGSTCVAAVRTGRHFVGFDISPEYCTLAENRIAEIQPHPQPLSCDFPGEGAGGEAFKEETHGKL
jgi:modification methylase